jgi:PRTRC genetic system protein C
MPGAALEVERVFRMGTIELPDLAPELAPLKSVRLYVQQWPHLRRAKLADPIMEGNRAVYEVVRAPVQTKG